MYQIILLILFLLVLYVVFFNSNGYNIEKMTATPKPERCFYDFELITLHNIFMDALSKDQAIQKIMKNKILPAVCILDMVANKKQGWSGFLDYEANKRGTNKAFALRLYLNDEYTKVYTYAIDNGLGFLTQPYKMEIKTINPTTGDTVVVEKEVNVMKEFEDIINKKLLTIVV
jgi:hypothetical protein